MQRVFFFGRGLYLQRGADFFDLSNHKTGDVLKPVDLSFQKDLVRVRPFRARCLYRVHRVKSAASNRLIDFLGECWEWLQAMQR